MASVVNDALERIGSKEEIPLPMVQFKRKNGRISWKARALKAEHHADLYFWLGLVLTVIMFFLGVNVGLYAF